MFRKVILNFFQITSAFEITKVISSNCILLFNKCIFLMRRKQGALGKEDKKRHWQRLRMKRKSRRRRKEGNKEHWEKRITKDADSDWKWKERVCVYFQRCPPVGSLRVYMYIKSYKHTKQVAPQAPGVFPTGLSTDCIAGQCSWDVARLFASKALQGC